MVISTPRRARLLGMSRSCSCVRRSCVARSVPQHAFDVANHYITFLAPGIASLHTHLHTMLSSLRVSARRAVAAAPSAAGKLRQGAAASVPGIEQTACRAFATVPGPRLFDYETVTSVLKQSDAVEAIEAAFGMLAKGKVDVPIPMHIGIDESDNAGPGDCHIKGGYISGTSTWTVKLANVSFYKNIEKVGKSYCCCCCFCCYCALRSSLSLSMISSVE